MVRHYLDEVCLLWPYEEKKTSRKYNYLFNDYEITIVWCGEKRGMGTATRRLILSAQNLYSLTEIFDLQCIFSSLHATLLSRPNTLNGTKMLNLH